MTIGIWNIRPWTAIVPFQSNQLNNLPLFDIFTMRKGTCWIILLCYGFSTMALAILVRPLIFFPPCKTDIKIAIKQNERSEENSGQDGRGTLKGLRSVPLFQNNWNDKHIPGLFSPYSKQRCLAAHQIMCQDKPGLEGLGEWQETLKASLRAMEHQGLLKIETVFFVKTHCISSGGAGADMSGTCSSGWPLLSLKLPLSLYLMYGLLFAYIFKNIILFFFSTRFSRWCVVHC